MELFQHVLADLTQVCSTLTYPFFYPLILHDLLENRTLSGVDRTDSTTSPSSPLMLAACGDDIYIKYDAISPRAPRQDSLYQGCLSDYDR